MGSGKWLLGLQVAQHGTLGVEGGSVEHPKTQPYSDRTTFWATAFSEELTNPCRALSYHAKPGSMLSLLK